MKLCWILGKIFSYIVKLYNARVLIRDIYLPEY